MAPKPVDPLKNAMNHLLMALEFTDEQPDALPWQEEPDEEYLRAEHNAYRAAAVFASIALVTEIKGLRGAILSLQQYQ